MNNVQYKYKIGDDIYFISEDGGLVTCNSCFGEGVLLRKNGDEIECPNCRGEGMVYDKIGFKVYKDKIRYVNISLFGDIISITYELEHYSDDTYTEDKLYGSIEEANKKCEILNQKKL